jgi:hypothetical protein
MVVVGIDVRLERAGIDQEWQWSDLGGEDLFDAPRDVVVTAAAGAGGRGGQARTSIPASGANRQHSATNPGASCVKWEEAPITTHGE